MVFFLDIPTFKMRSLLCVETMGIDDPVTRRHIPPERETSAICCENLNSGLLRWMLAWGLVDRATVGAEDGQGSYVHKILEYLRPSGIQYSRSAAPHLQTVGPSVHYVCLLAVRGKPWAQSLYLYLAVVLLYIKLDPKKSLLQAVLRTSLIALCTKLEWHFSSCISIETEVVFEFCFKKSLLRIYMRYLTFIFI